MGTSVYFQNYNNFNEQNLIDDLVIESIQIYGLDIIYLNRKLTGVDNILNEDDISVFDETHEFEVYVKNVEGFEGEGDFLSRFGLQIRDQITFTVAHRTFEKYATRDNADLTRPYEGDLIYFPLNEKLFKVMHVEHESVFYQTGALQVYDMRCELFEYSGERFDTGIPNIDNFWGETGNTNPTLSTNLEQLANTDPIAKNLFFEQEADGIIDFSEIDPFSETIDIQDNF
jgi:hypothetical protein